MKECVLVAGGAGYIGTHTAVELIEAGHTPIVIDNLSNSNPESLRRVAEITGKTIEFIEGDVRDEALLEKIFAEHEISCVIHFAGLKAVGESVRLPLLLLQYNPCFSPISHFFLFLLLRHKYVRSPVSAHPL